MKVTEPPSLRAIVGLDAATCAAMAALLLAGAEFLSGLLAVPRDVLTAAGAILIPVAAFMAFVAERPSAPRWATWTVVAGNAAWVIASVALALGSFIAPTPLGVAFILAQAAVVSLFAAAEYRAIMRKTGSVETLA